MVDPEASDKVLKTVVGVALTSLNALQDDYATLQRDGESCQLDMSTELAALLADAGKCSLESGTSMRLSTMAPSASSHFCTRRAAFSVAVLIA